jgi:spectrin beta
MLQTLELELDTYSGIVNEMGHCAGAMVAGKHPDARAVAAKQQLIQQQMRTLQRLATSRQQRLMESMYRHEYFLESAELEQWIREQVQTAASEDYGQDYEHLLVRVVRHCKYCKQGPQSILNGPSILCA